AFSVVYWISAEAGTSRASAAGTVTAADTCGPFGLAGSSPAPFQRAPSLPLQAVATPSTPARRAPAAARRVACLDWLPSTWPAPLPLVSAQDTSCPRDARRRIPVACRDEEDRWPGPIWSC